MAPTDEGGAVMLTGGVWVWMLWLVVLACASLALELRRRHVAGVHLEQDLRGERHGRR